MTAHQARVLQEHYIDNYPNLTHEITKSSEFLVPENQNGII